MIYSICQVSNHYQKTIQPTCIDWEMSLESYNEAKRSGKVGEILLELTFKCRAFQTDVSINETFRSALHVLKWDDTMLSPRLIVTIAMKHCPVECMAMVTLEVPNWLKASRCNGLEQFCPSCRDVRGTAMKNITSSQLYQTSLAYYLRRANLEPCTHMFYTLEGSNLMTKAKSYLCHDHASINLDFRCPHKTRSLASGLLPRNLCLMIFQGIASLVDCIYRLPRLKGRPTFEIDLFFCQSCIPVVGLALKYLLNTLSFFHAFLPIDRLLILRSRYDPDNRTFYWFSTRPVGWLDSADILFYNGDPPRTKLSICANTDPESFPYDPSYLMVSSRQEFRPFGRCCRRESHSHLLPKP